ncbi:hypothetical protein ELG79_02510 [Rhizobium leguminosarum]|uniref:hypothetical protein n=1 Tax=Rhizobium leguminosarum TaxID=384 RepID=UPI001031FCFD|nr:hypothetical protein [Rhizobium leguminosarum]TBG24194.1 hypothetical protein ELG79_02510 [Rhizobium leguminosarum]TBG40715.1 hypothetical protein ELG77_02495 [Rhizobium leguminosarum]
MIEWLKSWVAKVLKLPLIHRDVMEVSRRVDLLTQQADRLNVQLTHWETQAAAWQAVLVNEQIKIRSVLDGMDLVLRGVAASPAHSRPEAGGTRGGNGKAVAALSEEVRQLRADLIECTRSTRNERSQ